MGSLREALFLTIWMRRQEVELQKVRILAQGLAQTAEDGDIMTIYKSVSEAIFPFLKTYTKSTDQEMIARMKKEVDKGVISFNEVNMSPLKRRASELGVSDDFKAKMQQRAAQSKKRVK
jgi:hypothetical protein